MTGTITFKERYDVTMMSLWCQYYFIVSVLETKELLER